MPVQSDFGHTRANLENRIDTQTIGEAFAQQYAATKREIHAHTHTQNDDNQLLERGSLCGGRTPRAPTVRSGRVPRFR